MASCGLDFGTSNTTLGTLADQSPRLTPLEGGQTAIPSAIFYERDGSVFIGRKAIDAYVEGMPGRLMRSLKSVLGTALVDETTRVGRERASFRDIIANYLGAVKRRAEQALGREIRYVVHGRPVHFVDGAPDADRKAEQTLRDIARKVGFDEVTFQFEPIAAALDYERQISAEEIALIVDIGGGTSDFSIIRLGPKLHQKADRTSDILANDGVRIGGTDFDRVLSLERVMPLFGYRSVMKRAELNAPSRYFHDLATWSRINAMYDQKVMAEIRQVRYESASPELFDRLIRVLDEQRGHTLAMEVEGAKIALSDKQRTEVVLQWIEPDLAASITQADLVTCTRQLAKRIVERIDICLKQARIAASEINAVFLTGGSTQLAHVRSAIVKTVPTARVVDGDIFGAVGQGLTIEAAQRYGS